MKKTLSEEKLRKIVKNTINEIIKEEVDNYYGGGLPDRYFADDKSDYVNDVEDIEDSKYFDKLSDIFDKIEIDSEMDEKIIDAFNVIGRYVGMVNVGIKTARNTIIPAKDISAFINWKFPFYKKIRTKLGIIKNQIDNFLDR